MADNESKKELRKLIRRNMREVIPDKEKSKILAKHLVSDAIGVRSIERLYDVDHESLGGVLPKCDEARLIRAWRSQFRPERLQRQQMQDEPLSIYSIKWNTIPASIMAKLQRGKWLPKKMRCTLVSLIVSDVRHEIPDVKRSFYDGVAKDMVQKFPASLQDRGFNSKPHQCTYYKKKLQCKDDEIIRATKKKSAFEAPQIPQAYGCKKWRTNSYPPNETNQTLEIKKAQLINTFNTTRRKDWVWPEILQTMELTYKLQRDDLNSQVPPRKRRGRGRQQPQPAPKTTAQISEEWPFLFQSRGMLQHFKLLTGVDFLKKLEEFNQRIDIQDLLAFLRSYSDSNKRIMKKLKAAEKQQTCSDPHDIALCLMLVRALKEKEELILLEIEKTTAIDDVEEATTLPPTPCIVSLGQVFEAKKFYFAIDSKVHSAVPTFWGALSMLFTSYFVFNLKYPKDIGNTMEYYQRVVAGIDGHGTKVDRTNYRSKVSEKLQTLIDAYESYQTEDDGENAEDENAEEENVDDDRLEF